MTRRLVSLVASIFFFIGSLLFMLLNFLPEDK